MKMVKNPGGHPTALFSRAEKKRNGETHVESRGNFWSSFVPLVVRHNANVRRLCMEKSGLLEEKEGLSDSGSTTYSVHGLRILFTFLEPHL